MSGSVLIAPHNDDETLFAAYTLMRECPQVVVALRDVDNYSRRRESETFEAVYQLTGQEGYEQWTFDASNPDWRSMSAAIEALGDEYDVVYAPAVLGEQNGYPDPARPPRTGWGVLQHDHIGHLASAALGDKVRPYCLYTRWGGRHVGEREVVPTATEIARKLSAMSVYLSAIEVAATRSWFLTPDLREWLA